jgi:methionyl-tRNA synthetase
MTFGLDSNFSEAALVQRLNADLANDIGNLLSRVVTLIATHCDGLVPEPGPLGPDEEHLRDAAIAAAGGPTKTRPAAVTALANAAFSLRKP